MDHSRVVIIPAASLFPTRGFSAVIGLVNGFSRVTFNKAWVYHLISSMPSSTFVGSNIFEDVDLTLGANGNPFMDPI